MSRARRLLSFSIATAALLSGGDAANQNAAVGVGPDASMAPPGASGPGGGAPPPMPRPWRWPVV